LEARVTEQQKQLIEKAAFLRGQNLTEFMVSILTETAIQTIKDYQLLKLSDRDLQAFAEALLNSPTPSETAYTDAKWYQQITNK
jgi:uncharacterized protein (DUF1778 family)